eukprot:TRINITY_DN39128_c0_g1_i1.p1 TRINITY_DN39128_c0_g1~~TRINITY_DN39128_c0_g1_i1.p1  ORF type:complete len:659 (-),score=22.91 TRINITY_DN39128_c0_g1_i1:230-2161(-)
MRASLSTGFKPVRWEPRFRPGESPARELPTEGGLHRAQPQVLRSGDKQQEVWPEYWGITISQLRALLKECQDDPSWSSANSLRVVVERYVLPRTAGTGLGFALLINKECPKEVSVMISHSWSENMEEFVETLSRTVSKNEVMFICALSIFQNQDGSGPSIAEQIGSQPEESPFYRVLWHLSTQGHAAGWRWLSRGYWKEVPLMCFQLGVLAYALSMVTIGSIPMLDEAATLDVNPVYADNPEGRRPLIWHFGPLPRGSHAPTLVSLVFFVLACLTRWVKQTSFIYLGRMVAVPNREEDLYSRLWCVYEIFVATDMGIYVELASTLAKCGVSNCRNATCSWPADELRIRRQIEDLGRERGRCAEDGFDMVDAVIRKTVRLARWPFISHSIRWSLVGAACMDARFSILSPELDEMIRISHPISLYWIASIVGFACSAGLVYPFIFSRGVEGCVSTRQSCVLTLMPVSFALLLYAFLEILPCDYIHYDSEAPACAAAEFFTVVTFAMILFSCMMGTYFVFSTARTDVTTFTYRLLRSFLLCIPVIVYWLCCRSIWKYRPVSGRLVQLRPALHLYGGIMDDLRTKRGVYPSCVFLLLEVFWLVMMTSGMWNVFATWGVTRRLVCRCSDDALACSAESSSDDSFSCSS